MKALRGADIEDITEGLGDDARWFGGRRLLITGANGFLGRYFVAVVRHLNATVLSEPCQVMAIDNLLTSDDVDAETLADPNVTSIRHDVVEPFDPGGRIDAVIHAAGIASPYYYRKFPEETMDVATVGLRNMLELAVRHDARLVSFSSSEVYGDPDSAHVPTREDYNGNVSSLGPRGCYDESKRFGETLLRVFAERRGLHAVIVRPFNVYGPGMSRTDYRVLPNIADRVVAGEAVSVYGSGRQTRTFCYITDAVRGFLLALLRGRAGEAYNIGAAGPEISIVALIDLVRDEVPVPGLTYRVVDYPDSYPDDEPSRRCPDLSKAAQQLGYRPAVELPDGLRRFIGWARDAYR